MIRWLKNVWSKLISGDPFDRLRAGAPSTRNQAGALGEQTAADFLRTRHGYTIVTRNWRSPRDLRDEIDLVCRDGDVLVFVEVKARAAGALVSGYLAVDERKKRALRRAVQAYLGQLTPAPRTFRLDIVEVTLSGRLPPQVMHYENAPLFPKGYHLARQHTPGDVPGP
jgi:putative endonuclease